MVKLQKRIEQGQYLITLNKDLVENLGWDKGTELIENIGADQRSIIVSKKR